MAACATTRLYLDDEHCLETDAIIVAEQEHAIACDRTCFYPGGGGQPADSGMVRVRDNESFTVVSAHVDADDVIWHAISDAAPAGMLGQTVRLTVDRQRRRVLARYHTVLHVLNTIALRDYGAWITGVQIASEYSRIDFKLEGFSAAVCAELEQKVNAVLAADRPLRAYYVTEDEFRRRDDLRRTLSVTPPVRDGSVRVVEI